MRIGLSLNFAVNKWIANQAVTIANVRVDQLLFLNLLDYLPGAFLDGGGAIPLRNYGSQPELVCRSRRR